MEQSPHDSASGDPPPTAVPAQLPLVTYSVIAICTLIFLLFFGAQGGNQQTLSDVLAPANFQIWHGAVWGLVTSAFVHVAFWHLLFNMMWAHDFGRVLEPEMGGARYLSFIVTTAAVASGWQLLVSGQTGIGYSGVVYAMFGYLLARRASHPAYAAILTPRTTQWMLGWLVLCFVLTLAKVWSVANAAHVGGLAAGYVAGLLLERRERRGLLIVGSAILLAGAVLSCCYVPWSDDWPARAWLHEFDVQRRGAHRGDAKSQAAYGSMLMSWPESRAEGLVFLRRAAEAGNADGMNGLAWWLAVAREDKLRNGSEAVRWAEKAYRAAPNPTVADTLAAAYAEADRWGEAVALQQRCSEAADSDTQKPMLERLELYKKHEKWRE